LRIEAEQNQKFAISHALQVHEPRIHRPEAKVKQMKPKMEDKFNNPVTYTERYRGVG
jgi:hypothetical protein